MIDVDGGLALLNRSIDGHRGRTGGHGVVGLGGRLALSLELAVGGRDGRRARWSNHNTGVDGRARSRRARLRNRLLRL